MMGFIKRRPKCEILVAQRDQATKHEPMFSFLDLPSSLAFILRSPKRENAPQKKNKFEKRGRATSGVHGTRIVERGIVAGGEREAVAAAAAARLPPFLRQPLHRHHSFPAPPNSNRRFSFPLQNELDFYSGGNSGSVCQNAVVADSKILKYCPNLKLNRKLHVILHAMKISCV